MPDTEYPVIIRNDAQFNTLVKVLKYTNHWDKFDFVYENKLDVPRRLHGFTVIASNDPAEPYGALLQVAPSKVKTGTGANNTGYKLLAKIRLN